MKRTNLINNLELTELERGDYQTPLDFAKVVCEYIKSHRGCNPKKIIEPTCGLGNFIDASIDVFDNIEKIYGIEIENSYYKEIVEKFKHKEMINLFNENIFNFNFDVINNSISNDEELLIIGNPPWVTNSQLESINSINLPSKKNLKKLGGLDAMTGKSNFDISEYIILKLIETFQGKKATIAMLCKNTVIRNIVRDINSFDLKISGIEMVSFDSKEVFGISCDASLLILDISNILETKCNVYNIYEGRDIIRSFGWSEDRKIFISDMNEYNQISNIDGECKLEWRQGIKHDCSKIMQLSKNNNLYVNGNKEEIELEEDYIYPMLKSSDIKNTIINDTRKYVIVTQRKVGQDTNVIELEAPNLWNYLMSNAEYLDKRKSSIYKKAPRFSIFGVGDYSFAKYKVCISGFYKEPKFSLAFRSDNKPIMLDDTCYFLGFDTFKDALITTILLNSELVNTFLKSIAFLDSKRPYTKEILKRLDLEKIYNNFSYEQFNDIKNKLNVDIVITKDDYLEYRFIFNQNNNIEFDSELSSSQLKLDFDTLSEIAITKE